MMDNQENKFNISGDSPLFSARATSRNIVRQPDAEKNPNGCPSPENVSMNQQSCRPAGANPQPKSPADINAVNGNFNDNPSGKSTAKPMKKKLHLKSTERSSSRQKLMYLLIPVLAVVFIFVLRQVFSKSPNKSQAAPTGNTPVQPSAKHASDGEINWKIPEPLKAEIRDPVKHGVPAASNTTVEPNKAGIDVLYVKGILFSADKPSVVIGKKIIHLNDEYNGVKVVEINRDYVIFEKDGNRWTKKVTEYMQGQILTKKQD
jgi:hypothetical protein